MTCRFYRESIATVEDQEIATLVLLASTADGDRLPAARARQENPQTLAPQVAKHAMECVVRLISFLCFTT